MPGSLEIKDLEAFVAVAETGSFTTAAQGLFLTQPTISARVAVLEASLRTRLFERGARQTSLTPAGRILLPHARTLLRGREKAVGAVRQFLDGSGGTLDIAASSVPGTYVLPRLLADLHRTHPDVHVRLAVKDSDEAVDALRRGEVELAVIGRRPREKWLDASRVAEDEIFLVATPDLLRAQLEQGGPRARSRKPSSSRAHGKSRRLPAMDLPTIKRLPLVLRESGSATRALALAALAAEGVRPETLNVVLELGSNGAVLEAALAGIGAVFLSRFAVRGHLAAKRLEVLPTGGFPLKRPLILVSRAGRTLSPAASALAKLLRRTG